MSDNKIRERKKIGNQGFPLDRNGNEIMPDDLPATGHKIKIDEELAFSYLDFYKQKKTLYFTRERLDTLFRELATDGRIKRACQVIDFPYPIFCLLRKHNPNLDRACREAIAIGNESLLDVARMLANGYEKPIVYQGEVSEKTVTTYSETMLKFLIQAQNPEYRPQRDVNVKGDPDNPIKHEASVRMYLPQNGRSSIEEEMAGVIDMEDLDSENPDSSF